MGNSVSASRLKNAKRNVSNGIIKQFVGIGLSFAIRTGIIYALGAEYQGLSGLFTAILQVLSLADLGFSTAVTFVLYKPIAEDDTKTICAIVAFLKKVYRIVGLVVLVIGLCIMPFLEHLISGSYPNDINLYILFLIYLGNAVVSYFLFAYKSTLLTAMQRDDIVSKIFTFTSIVIKTLQLILLFVFRNYYVFIIILPLGSVINNCLLQIVSRRVFPELEAKGTIDAETKAILTKQVKAVFINRLSDIARNCFDDIIVSSFIGLVAVAAYDNYYYIFTAILGIMSIIIHSIRASVGNSLVKESKEKNFVDLQKFTFLFMWISGWCSVCMFILYQPFMTVWMKGKSEMLLSFGNMILFCLYFYSYCMTHTKGVYLESKGLFWECRKLYIIEALGNLALNIILGYFFGITGVLLATIVTILVVNFLGGTEVLFKHYFEKKPSKFYLLHLKCFLATIVSAGVTFGVCSLVQFNGIMEVVVKLIICIFVPNVVYYLLYCKTEQFNQMIGLAKRLIGKQ